MSTSRAPLRIPVEELNENDVLLGRGTGPSHYIGTQRFRALAVSRKEEYNSVDSYKIKKRIGSEIYDEITRRGGRFLQQVSSNGRATARNGARDIILYEEVSRKKGEDKCKQLLREKAPAKKQQGKAKATKENAEQVTEAPDDHHDDNVAGSPEPHGASLSETSPTFMSAGHDVIGFEGIHFPELAPSAQDVVGKGPSPPPSPSLGPILPSTMLDNQHHTDAHIGLFPLDQQASCVASSNDQATQQSPGHVSTFPGEVLRVRAHSLDDGGGGDDDAHALDDDVSASFLTALGVGPDEPRFSQQDEIQEKAALTEEERISILVDKFGSMCSITEHQSKRRHKDIDGASASFLLKQMRATIDMIPPNEKEALLEAIEHARPQEFSDSRLEQFLRCEGMNREIAARRFIRYWEHRRDLFGRNKFTKCMILSEALCDDIASLQAGIFTLLPQRDLSGRHLVFIQGTRLSSIEYEPASMVRAYWYLMEIVVQEGGTSFIVLDWLKNASLFDYDRNVFLPVVYLATNVWPIGPPTGHTCCPPKILVWLFKPVAFALLGKEARNRNNMHDIPPEQIADELSSFGITKEMLPTQMGGSIVLNPSEWIAKRRAVEMEEIE